MNNAMKSKKERVVEMNYVVTNDKLYIRLSSDGSPVTCSKSNAQIFDKEKAENIQKNLPKVLKNFHFRVKPAPQSEQEVPQDKTKTDNVQSEEKKYIRKDSYIPCDEVVQWIEKSRQCSEFVEVATRRRTVLHKKLANVDRELSNCMHQIELEKWKSGCDGYKLYKLEKEILEKRRQIKDELVIIQSVLDNTKCTIGIKNIEKTFNRLGTRRFEIRIIEDDDFFDEEHT